MSGEFSRCLPIVDPLDRKACICHSVASIISGNDVISVNINQF